ncbi:ABC transporter permease [Pseudodesulfovibrio sediminis]|uniref:Spermidine/putrescine ABC transporter permease n=1 Tax=Pseudodesulfovibrio sediminis TaxID=2810563 RepID=A0ABM7P8K8_9BACT|nr:ABC transporter permease [Pseudodesulfovibrio sediminis]BCS89762.1 spermidine/putrescine ABC transporter permease [Pseudodesulfovibrio sediminis]
MTKHTQSSTRIWFGEMTTRRALRRRGLLHITPGLFWILMFLTIPALALIALSFATRGGYGEIQWIFTFENYTRLAGYGLFGWSPDYLYILARSLWVALVTTVVCTALAFPLSFYIAKKPKHTRYIWLTLVIIPFWTNLVIRTYAWQLVLSPDLPIAKFAAVLGLIPAGSPLYPSSFAVYMGMISAFLPFIVLPLYSSVEKLDWSLVEAAYDLYSDKRRVFMQAILPQTLPGLSVGAILTFVPAMGMFLIPDFLGGAKYMLVGNLIQQQFGKSRDWPFGAAVSLALMALTLIGLFLFRRKGQDIEVV